jgi:hypothetical protein
MGCQRFSIANTALYQRRTWIKTIQNLLGLMRNDLDVIHEHFARHFTSLGPKRQNATKAVFQISLCVLMIDVAFQA